MTFEQTPEEEVKGEDEGRRLEEGCAQRRGQQERRLSAGVQHLYKRPSQQHPDLCLDQ